MTLTPALGRPAVTTSNHQSPRKIKSAVPAKAPSPWESALSARRLER